MASTTFIDGTTPVVASWLNDVNAATYTGKFGTGPLLGGLTNPIVTASLGANNYVQNYIYNPTNGTSASADFAAYANNSTANTGFVDIGFTSQTYADANYTVTGPNEAYLFGSAPSGSGKTGNLVLATDSTGTNNAIQFYVGGFNQPKISYKMQIDSTGVTVPALFTTTQTTGDNSTKVATTAFVAASVGLLSGRNKITNGKMDIAQRGASFAAIANGAYSLDRWLWGFVSSGAVTITQQADAPSDNEFQYSLRAAVTTADTSIAATDTARVIQRIEGFNVRDLIGRTFTLSFRVRSSKTGVHCVALGNSVGDRSYVAEYTINAANTWETKSITVTGGLITAGTWNYLNGVGLEINWVLAAGSTYQSTAGAWQTGNFLATANQVNCLDTVGNIFAITGVQLEVGAVATPFEHRPFGMEFSLCQRYYQTGLYASAWVASGTLNAGGQVNFFTPMRAAPTISLAGVITIADGGVTKTQATATIATQTSNPYRASLNLSAFTGLTANALYITDAGSNAISATAEL